MEDEGGTNMKELKINEEYKPDSVKKYTLLQYTPHIHFQADEEGVTLRASEVKPKLDRFIRMFAEKKKIVIPERCEIVNSDKQNIDDRKPALKYSVFISANEQQADNIEFPKYSTFFGNMGDGSKKECVYYKNGLQIVFSAPEESKGLDLSVIRKDKESILDLIDYVLPAFFSFNCFGTRSTKGWGSYGVVGKEIDNKYLGEFMDVYYKVPLVNKNWEDRLDVVRVLSGMMKGGFNYGGYYKGRIFRYYTKNKIGSDKAYMKQMILPGELDKNKESESRSRYDKFVYARGAIGIAGSYEFRKGKKTDREGTIGVFDKRDKAVDGDEKNVIKRFNLISLSHVVTTHSFQHVHAP